MASVVRTHAAVLSLVALTFASWPGGPSAQAKIVAHGAPIDELANGPSAALKAPPEDALTESFDVVMVNTRERATVHCRGPKLRPDPESYATLKHLFRAHPSEKEGPLDVELVDVLRRIAKATNGTIEVVSAYRKPRHRWDHNYHVRGEAADIRVPGMWTYKLVRLAKKLGINGIGNYPTSAFVHVDVRDVRYWWTDWSGPGSSR